jgi:hypothetical protein
MTTLFTARSDKLLLSSRPNAARAGTQYAAAYRWSAEYWVPTFAGTTLEVLRCARDTSQ